MCWIVGKPPSSPTIEFESELLHPTADVVSIQTISQCPSRRWELLLLLLVVLFTADTLDLAWKKLFSCPASLSLSLSPSIIIDTQLLLLLAAAALPLISIEVVSCLLRTMSLWMRTSLSLASISSCCLRCSSTRRSSSSFCFKASSLCCAFEEDR